MRNLLNIKGLCSFGVGGEKSNDIKRLEALAHVRSVLSVLC